MLVKVSYPYITAVMMIYRVRDLLKIFFTYAFLCLNVSVSVAQFSELDKLIKLADEAIAHEPTKLDSILDRSFDLAIAFGDREKLAMVYNQLGVSRAMKTDLGPAIQAFQESWKLALEINDTLLQVNALSNMAGVHQYAGQLDKAAEKLNRAVEIVSTGDYPQTLARTELALGIVYKSMGDLNLAKKAIRKSMDSFDEEGNLSRYLFCVEELGAILEAEGDYDGATKLYKFVLSGRDYQEEQSYKISIYQRLGSVFLKQGDYRNAMENLEKSIYWADELNNHLEEDSTLAMLIQTSAALAQLDKTTLYTNRLMHYHKQQQVKNAEETIAQVETEYLLSEKELENKLLKAQHEQSQAELSRSRTLLFSSVIIIVLFAALAALVFVYFKKERQHGQQLAKFNEELEAKVKEKTAEVVRRNERLYQMSFQLAHELRSGVATILGLKNLMDEQKFPENLDPEIYEGYTYATERLDNAIKKMIRHLDEDEELTGREIKRFMKEDD
ncbi:MAG: tetratricopeptide repeat protein [Flavobacteriales bacterium]